MAEISSFQAFSLSADLQRSLERLKFLEPTPVQSLALPPLLSGKDVVVKSQTGSGKTLAFSLAILQRIDRETVSPQALVLCPTRELAEQVAKVLRQLAALIPNIKVQTLCGGSPLAAQRESLQFGAQVLVGTVGRVNDHLQRKNLSLSKISVVVLDEADRMLDMGFHDGICEILVHTPSSRQTMMFSATYPENMFKLSSSLQRNPLSLEVKATEETSPDIEEIAYEVEDKFPAALATIATLDAPSILLYCNTKAACQELATMLEKQRLSVLALHGDLEQRERTEILVRFVNRSCHILVATDVAARGLHIDDLAAVMNVDLPRDPEVYVHRIGRTGRMGKKGRAISFFTARERHLLERIATFRSRPIPTGLFEVPSHEAVSSRRLPAMATLLVNVGRKNKFRAGDFLGALTANGRIPAQAVGKIHVCDYHAYIAVETALVIEALSILGENPVKARTIKVRRL